MGDERSQFKHHSFISTLLSSIHALCYAGNIGGAVADGFPSSAQSMQNPARLPRNRQQNHIPTTVGGLRRPEGWRGTNLEDGRAIAYHSQPTSQPTRSLLGNFWVWGEAEQKQLNDFVYNGENAEWGAVTITGGVLDMQRQFVSDSV